ncbi:hypothetical protein PGT21_003129 [Puccinia graminis f. sp. tritici]|uniref:Uncharacterized protein n=1 Tax=Puccinia graminis f. sp. tritici TaxID=56615 RepID=A0A5B0R4I2_PUCGR|nr:hypothetical protein PGT21_003129 [Puccinia graminis f. sp. tritici]KAA1120372.1 hypothetical protein PGTUg99_003287 [Puccinia graminis f. sp. tritici]
MPHHVATLVFFAYLVSTVSTDEHLEIYRPIDIWNQAFNSSSSTLKIHVCCAVGLELCNIPPLRPVQYPSSPAWSSIVFTYHITVSDASDPDHQAHQYPSLKTEPSPYQALHQGNSSWHIQPNGN